jgi:hypothetical protein
MVRHEATASRSISPSCRSCYDENYGPDQQGGTQRKQTNTSDLPSSVEPLSGEFKQTLKEMAQTARRP